MVNIHYVKIGSSPLSDTQPGNPLDTFIKMPAVLFERSPKLWKCLYHGLKYNLSNWGVD
jgi:hypothetical protein